MIRCEYEKRGCLNLKEHNMITREEFEKLLKNKNALDLFSVFNKTDLVELFGHDVAEMYGYDQSNPHHCYDLWNHTLRTVDSISPDGIDENDFLTLRIVAFFHDIGKPLCCKIKPDGKKSFHGHPQKSVVLARPILKEIGYDKNEIDRICLFIGHHDDFINFANKLPERLKQDIFLREPSKIAVKEVLIKNMFDFKKMGYDVFEIQYITSFLATGKSRKFTHSGLPIEADVDMKEVLKKMQDKKYRIKDVPDNDDYS